MKTTDGNELVFLGAHQLAKAIRERKVSAIEVLQAHRSHRKVLGTSL